MLADARGVTAGDVVSADVCIIGAGAAGITIARELAGSGMRIVVLESGAVELEPETQALYQGEVTGLPYFPLDATRLRFLGGATNHWGGVCRPFAEEDFERRDWIPFSGWPIQRRDLDPYYGEASAIVGLPSDDFSAESWEAQDSFSPLDLGPGTETRVAQIVDDQDRSFATRYREELDAADDVRVYMNANALEIETDPGGSLATRVRVATLEGNEFSVEAGRFVLAAGGIENPRLLLASRAQQPRGLGNEHDLVGRFFIEHPRFLAAVAAPSDPGTEVGFYEIHHVGDSDIQGYVALTKELLAEEEIVDVQVFVDPVYDAGFEAAFDSPDVDALKAVTRAEGPIDDFGRNLMDVVGDLTTFRGFTIPGAPLPVPYPDVVAQALDGGLREYVPGLFGDIAADGYRRVYGSAPLEAIELVTRLDQAPNPDSRVTLSDSRDALGMPRAELHWQLTELDRRSAALAAELLATEFASAGLGRVRIVFDEDASGWPDDLEGGNHHCGTTRMSDDPTEGVVDRDCRVHGMANLYVAGSSVFTTGGDSPPTLTLVALALRLADHLRKDLG